MTPETFKPMDFPLTGTRLIEASAGTGKTYNIANLYLRLVMGHDTEPRTVDRILVVTFTRAAAAELRGRIRGLLELAYEDFREGESDHSLIDEMIREIPTEERADWGRRLHEALLQFDEACISTIHGFAVKVASTLLFETGAIESAEISVEGADVQKHRIDDLYRRLAAGRDEEDRAFFDLVCGKSAKDFRAYYGERLQAQVHWKGHEPGEGAFDELRDRYAQLVRDYRSAREAWFAIVGDPPSGGADGVRDALQACVSRDGFKPSKHFANYLIGHLRDAFPSFVDKTGTQYFDHFMSLGTNDGDGPLFDVLLRLRDCVRELGDVAEHARPVLLELAQERLHRLDLKALTLDEIIRLINARLEREGAREGLIAQVRALFPVCLVDEFQDTDPEQFLMFQKLYGEPRAQDHGAFVMIGDPKQSIYEFRGADIFQYLNVRGAVEAARTNREPAGIYGLDVNFRSKEALVRATNALFAETGAGTGSGADPQATFVFPGMTYYGVDSCEAPPFRMDRGELRIGENVVKPLVFIGDDEDGDLSKGALRGRFARDAAERIARMVDPETGATLIDPGGERSRPVQPGDVAVLVRTGTEAGEIRERLARRGLRSVYLSQKDSVFESAIAEDLYHVLAALNEPDDQRRLRTALATPLLRGFDLRFGEVDALDAGEAGLESLIEEFGAYRDTWIAHGILTALNDLVRRRDGRLLERIAEHPDSDRVLTDLRHLADLLQQQDRDSSAPEQLLDWYAAQLEDDSGVETDSKRIRLESDENLVKILTIHVAKGLEFPVVFVPFFYLPWSVKLKKTLPIYRERDENGDWRPVVDFESDSETVEAHMQRERLAEEMRLLYVAVTRAVHQCHLGLSAAMDGKSPLFSLTPWAHLLEAHLDDEALGGNPDWETLRQALEARLADVADSVEYRDLGDAAPPSRTGQAERGEAAAGQRLVDTGALRAGVYEPPSIDPPRTTWRITSYSRLAHDKPIVLEGKDDEDETTATPNEAPDPAMAETGPDPVAALPVTEDDVAWAEDIRTTLIGGVQTGNCLHDVFEALALEPQRDLRHTLTQQLALRGLDRPFRPRRMNDADYRERMADYLPDLADWLRKTLDQPLGRGADAPDAPSLQALFDTGRALPEMAFDFRIGGDGGDARFRDIDRSLAAHGLAPLGGEGGLSGLMTGAIDLVFLHDRRIYVADYKSNKLGPSPRFYDRAHMDEAMRERRYDLQSLIYTVAAHRHFRRRLGSSWGYEAGEYRFGGVFYLFLRGMGLDAPFAGNGIHFSFPDPALVTAFDRALLGEAPEVAA